MRELIELSVLSFSTSSCKSVYWRKENTILTHHSQLIIEHWDISKFWARWTLASKGTVRYCWMTMYGGWIISLKWQLWNLIGGSSLLLHHTSVWCYIQQRFYVKNEIFYSSQLHILPKKEEDENTFLYLRWIGYDDHYNLRVERYLKNYRKMVS